MAGVVVCRDSSAMGFSCFTSHQFFRTASLPSNLPAIGSATRCARGNKSSKPCLFLSSYPRHLRRRSFCSDSERQGLVFGGLKSEKRLVARIAFRNPSEQSISRTSKRFGQQSGKLPFLESSKAVGDGSTQSSLSNTSEEENLTVDAEWEDLEEGEIDAAIAEVTAEIGYDVSVEFQEGETEDISVEEAVASLPVGLMDRSREVREYYQQRERKQETRSVENVVQRPSVEELRAAEEAALMEERREAASREEEREAAFREERREAALREEEEAVHSASDSDDEEELAADWKSQSREGPQLVREVPQEPNGTSTSDSAQDIRTVPIDEFGEPVWDYQPEKEADPDEEKYQMKADKLPPDLLEHLKKARDRKAERDTEVIEVGYDQVYGQQVPKWRKEIEEKEKAQKERERTQLEDYVFRKKLFSYVEKKGVKVNETRHTFDDEGREIARDGKPLNDLNVAEAKLDAESAEREAPQTALPDWEAPYEPFPEEEYSDCEDEIESDQDAGSAIEVVAETAQGAESVDEMREKLEERFRKLREEESQHESEALPGESSSSRSKESGETLSEESSRTQEAQSNGRTQESEATSREEEKSPWEKSSLPVTHLKDHEELGVDWGKEDYEDCFSDDEGAKNADAESKEERKARLQAMHNDLDRRMSDGKDNKKADLDVREELDREDDMPSQAELKELAKELEAALPKVTYKQMESLQPVLQDFGLAEEPLSELLLKPGFGNFMSDQLSKRSGTLARRQIKFPVAAVGQMLKDKGLKGRNIGEILASGKLGETRTVDLRKQLEDQNGSLVAEDVDSKSNPSSETGAQPDSTSWLESSESESGPEIQLDSSEESTVSSAESEELKRQLGLSEASLQDLFKDGLLKKEDVMDNLKSQLSQIDNEEFWGAEAEPIPDDDVKKVVETTKLPPTDGPIRFEGDQMSQEETWQLAETDPFEQPLVPQVSSAEWEELTADPSPLVVEVFATWAGPCKTMAVEVAKLARTMGERIRVVKINAENEKSLAAALRVANVPTIVFIRGHQVVMKLDSVTDLPGSDMVDIAEHIFFQGPFPECMKRAVDRQARR